MIANSIIADNFYDVKKKKMVLNNKGKGMGLL